MVIKVYVNLRSQPSRAILLFLKHTKIEFETVIIDLVSGEQRKPEYLKITPLGTIPAIKDGDFCLGELVAIIRYLATKYEHLVPEYLYPKDLRKRARVDEYMAFHHGGTRAGVAKLFFQEFVMPKFTGKHASEETLAGLRENRKTQLDKLERAFLQNNNYLAGDDITVADILAICEFMQPTVNGGDVSEGRPLLKAYIDRVKNRLNPIFDEVHCEIYEWRDSVLNKK